MIVIGICVLASPLHTLHLEQLELAFEPSGQHIVADDESDVECEEEDGIGRCELTVDVLACHRRFHRLAEKDNSCASSTDQKECHAVILPDYLLFQKYDSQERCDHYSR